MFLQAFPSGPFETNAYIVACRKTKHAAIVDPAPGSLTVIKPYLVENRLIPDKILVTHSHWDHIADAAEAKKEFPIPIYIHPEDAANLESPGSDGLPMWLDIEGVKPDHLLADGEEFTVGDLQFQAIHTPGHTPGGVCFYIKDKHVLLSGDTLFKGTIGNLSFPTARPKLMWDSLAKLSKLPPETKVYPGHGPSTTIGQETWLKNAQEYFD